MQGKLQLLADLHHLAVAVQQPSRENAGEVHAELASGGAVLGDKFKEALVVQAPKDALARGLGVGGGQAPAQEGHLPESLPMAEGSQMLALPLLVPLVDSHLPGNHQIQVVLALAVDHEVLVVGQDPLAGKLQGLEVEFVDPCAQAGNRHFVACLLHFISMQQFHGLILR